MITSPHRTARTDPGGAYSHLARGWASVAAAVVFAVAACTATEPQQETESTRQAVLLDPELARKDLGEVYTRGCASTYRDARARPCVFDYSIDADAPTVVATGDSKAAQWVPTLQVLAERHHWRLVTITKAGCAFSDTHRAWNRGLYTSCVAWNRSATEQIHQLRPDLLVTTQLDTYPTLVDGRNLRGERNREEMIRGLTARITAIQNAGIPVAAVAETPRMGFDTVECFSENLADPSMCERPRSQVVPSPDVVAVAALRSGAPIVDLTAQFCPDATCPAVRADVLVYRDGNHMTATYARSLAPQFEQSLADQLDTDLRDRLLPG